MSWGLIINGIFLSRATKDGLQERLERNERYVQQLRDELVALVSNTSTVYHDKEEDVSIIDHAIRRIPEIMSELHNLSVDIALTSYAIANPEKVTVDA